MKYSLVQDSELNLAAFKRNIKKLDWQKVPRKLGKEVQYFYLGMRETDTKLIKVKIRPSLSMTVTETFKNMTPEGKKPPKGYEGELVEYGTSIETKISEQFLEKLLSSVSEMGEVKTGSKIMEW